MGRDINKSRDIASIIVSKQLKKMIEQERKDFVSPPLPDFGPDCPFFTDQIMNTLTEMTIFMIVMTKISISASLN